MSQPHYYLEMLGVAPAYQGQGIGSLLLQPVLKQADTEGLPCYLQTTTEKAVRFYQKHGFEVLRTVELPKGGSQLWTMKRSPKQVISQL
nr:GNAT family N-acetyltransferase [Fischerella sp. PCC 9605]